MGRRSSLPKASGKRHAGHALVPDVLQSSDSKEDECSRVCQRSESALSVCPSPSAGWLSLRSVLANPQLSERQIPTLPRPISTSPRASYPLCPFIPSPAVGSTHLVCPIFPFPTSF